jgi:DNA-directed RNA polymerase subunit M
MEFCDECGSLMMPSKKAGKNIFKCKCGAVKAFSKDQERSYKLKKRIKHSPKEELTSAAEILDWKDKNLKSTIKDFRCPKCGYDKAQLETRQTRSADEGMTHFIICLKCGKMLKIGS